MKIIDSMLTRNPCYKEGRTINVKGLMLHSVGCAQPSAMAFVNYWNSESYVSACVHAFIDANTGDVYQTLPWNYRAWHGAGSSNNTHIGVEMCEPDCIKYVGGATFVCLDEDKAKAYAKRTYDAAVELFAYLCKEYALDPMEDGVIVSHSEGYKRGIANNHADPEHLWTQLKLSYTMDGFRKAVKEMMHDEGIITGKQITLNNTECFNSETTKEAYGQKTGVYYLWDDVVKNGRIRITNTKERVGVAGQVTCWINVADIGVDKKEESSSYNIMPGKVYTFIDAPVYSSETGLSIGKRTGTYYTWDAVVINGRIRMTNLPTRVNVPGQVSFWIDVNSIKKL